MNTIKTLIAAFILLLTNIASGQRVSDILANGIIVKDNKSRIFLKINGNGLDYDISNTPGLFDFNVLSDSSFFLIVKNQVNVFIRPFNPLKYSASTGVTFTEDEINKKTSETIGEISDFLKKLNGQDNPDPNPDNACGDKLISIRKTLDALKDYLKENKQGDIEKIFESLKKMDFEDSSGTRKDMGKEYTKIDYIVKYYDLLDSVLNKTSKDLVEYVECARTDIVGDPILTDYVYSQVINSLRVLYDKQRSQVDLLLKSYSLVEKMYNAAVKNYDGFSWCLPLKGVPVTNNKVSNLSVTINEDGYKLSEDKNIIKTDKTQFLNRVLRMRKFQRFVPEVSSGVAYTWIKFPKFGTVSDSTGKEFVADAGEEEFRNINFTAMINFNLYMQNSPLHPFFQIGIGANASYPTLFVGGGIRLNSGLKRIAVSGGLASSWAKKLNKYKIGDLVSGSAELEKDISYQFNFPLKPYLGIQYNF